MPYTSKRMTLIQVNKTEYLQNSYEGKDMKKIQLRLCVWHPTVFLLCLGPEGSGYLPVRTVLQFSFSYGKALWFYHYRSKWRLTQEGSVCCMVLQWQNNAFTSGYWQRSCQPSSFHLIWGLQQRACPGRAETSKIGQLLFCVPQNPV